MKSMGRLKLFAAVCIAALSATAASAADGKPYVGISAGLFMPADSRIHNTQGQWADIEYDTGASISGSGGFEFTNGLRLEGELTYKGADIDKFTFVGQSQGMNSDLSLLGFLANAFFDFKNSSPVTPYIGGGLGAARVYIGQGTNSSGGFFWNEDKDTVFAYQIGAGIGINAGQHLAFDLGYRYFGTSDIQFDQTTEADFSSHNLLAGVRYRF